MRTLLVCLIAASLSASPVAAGSDGNKDLATAPRTEAKNAVASKFQASESAKDASAGAQPSSSVEIELQQLKNELEAQRALLQAQQDRLAVLEEQLREAHANATVPASYAMTVAPAAADTDATAKVEAVAAKQQTMKKKVASHEGRLEQLGPFTFSGDFRLRSEPTFGGPVDHSLDRTRERYRLRFNVDAKLNDDLSGGFTLASGDINDPVVTNQTANQFFIRKPFFIDKAFINYNPGFLKPLTVTGGKFAYPWYRTELTWDKDLNPEGAAETLAFKIDTPILKKIALVGFELPFAENRNTLTTNRSFFNSMVYGGQIQTVWQLTDWLKFSAFSGYYGWQHADAVALSVVSPTANFSSTDSAGPLLGLLPLRSTTFSNSMATVTATSSTGVKTITSAQLASKFGMLDALAQFDVKTVSDRWPVVVISNFVQNTEACGNLGNISKNATFNVPCDSHARRGYWHEIRAGRAEKQGDWSLGYTRIFIEREAVLSAFNYSEIRLGSNVTEHRAEIYYQAYDRVAIGLTTLFGRQLVSASSPLEAWTRRFQFDVLYKF